MDEINKYIDQLNQIQDFILENYQDNNMKSNILLNLDEVIDFLEDEDYLKEIYQK